MKSISATELLKQQKRKQQELLQNRLRRAEEIQKRVLQNSAGPRPSSSSSSSSQGKDALMSPKAACQVPKGTQSPAAPYTPTLGRGFSEGEDILLFDKSPPQAAAASLSAAKMVALKKLKAKGMGLPKEDPNALKRKRGDSSEISARVEKSLASPEGTASSRCHFRGCIDVAWHKEVRTGEHDNIIHFLCRVALSRRRGAGSEEEARAAPLPAVRWIPKDPQR